MPQTLAAVPKKQTSAEFRVALGTVIRAERKRLGWSQETFAERTDLGRAYVTELEGGHRTPNLDTILRLARALGMKASKLISAAEVEAGRNT